MGIEAIGVLTILIGLACLRAGPRFAITILPIACLFGAAAAIKLPALGGASIPPAPLLLMFVTAAIALHDDLRIGAIRSLAVPDAGFWFVAIVVYGVLSAMFLPRIFADMTQVYSIARSGSFEGIITLPLAPRASNITQPVYLIGNLVCFAVVAGFARLGGSAVVARAVIATAALCVGFAALDLVTFSTGTQEIMSVIRNANYRMLDSGEISGFKRIVGSFSEAGAYGYTAIGLYAFMLLLWLGGYPSRLVGLLTLLLLATLLLSTSTTAYVALAFFSGIVLGGVVWRAINGRASTRELIYMALVALAIPIAVTGVMLLPGAWVALQDLYSSTVVYKLDSHSGVERMRWNGQALVAFVETSGFGTGIGSVRASSFVVAILASVGLPGLILFTAFFTTLLRPRNFLPLASHERTIARAAGAACLAQLAAASVSASAVDLGLMFSIYAGTLAAATQRARLASRSRPHAVTMPRSHPVPA